MSKPIYGRPHNWDTGWLGDGISVSDIDLAVRGKVGINIYEVKHDTPILSRVQKELVIQSFLHIVIALGCPREKEGKYNFETDSYKVYCPNKIQEMKYIERGYEITSPPQLRLSKDEIRPIFRGDAPWPCCGRTTFPR